MQDEERSPNGNFQGAALTVWWAQVAIQPAAAAYPICTSYNWIFTINFSPVAEFIISIVAPSCSNFQIFII
ncbi:MAG: hypothetical protein COW65_08395 [Cytophagales bacterium CG18_big_fil_WC_8_21_14_2_50_42_9]|nr:MAG: hypothetical protein COW65_08395 [Cytophagales bacterium CG18_big_fil_WC_8_21_14_2_50_42_9]